MNCSEVMKFLSISTCSWIIPSNKCFIFYDLESVVILVSILVMFTFIT